MPETLTYSEATFEACLERAVSALRAGGLVVYPTETVYGVACDARDAAAVDKLLRYKERPAGRSVPVLVSGLAMAREVAAVNAAAETLFGRWLPGPLTVVSESLGAVDGRLESELGTIGLRVSSHPFAGALAERFGGPVTATSAGTSRYPRVYAPERLRTILSPARYDLLDVIIDAGTLPKRERSAVIDTTQDAQGSLRPAEGGEEILLETLGDTAALAERLLRGSLDVLAEGALVFALEGEMGAGKTHFAKALAAALGVAEPVTSPTYSLVKEYAGKDARFVHMDLWRLGETVDSDELAIGDYMKPGTVLAIEWAGPLRDYFAATEPNGYLLRFVSPADGADTRTVTVRPL